eukprot:TRINITY_DN23068_c0_g1_i1.p1 TRINITY_DN23068_c0_g1~~TRINITY_DN23068_c0_g1_i1.p1  ORF type:complete len:177 (-),score=3.67 TRINITY_DN23068_c0_g1_i1:243-701(-)
MCTGQWPFEGLSFVQLAHAIVADDLRPPTKDCPPQLTKLITRCWDRNPDKRPDFDEIVSFLENLGAGKGSKRADDVIVPVPSADSKRVPSGKAGNGVVNVNTTKSASGDGSGSIDGIASRHGPREEPQVDSGWKKIQIDQPKESTGCGCTIL